MTHWEFCSCQEGWVLNKPQTAWIRCMECSYWHDYPQAASRPPNELRVEISCQVQWSDLASMDDARFFYLLDRLREQMHTKRKLAQANPVRIGYPQGEGVW